MSRASYRDTNVKQRPKSFSHSDGSDNDSDAEEKLYPDLNTCISNDNLESSWNRSKSDSNLSNSDSPERSFKNKWPSVDGFERSKTYEWPIRENYESKKQSPSFECSYSLIIILLAIIPIIYVFYLQSESHDDIQSIFDKLRVMFPKQPAETWSEYKAIMSDILENDPSYPVAFLLLYTEQNKIINNLVTGLAEYSSKKLHNNEKYIEVPNTEFHTSEALTDYGYLINKYREELFTKQVMVVKDLQDIPGEVAPVFHTLCDEISPITSRAVVYIFTLKVESLEAQKEIIATNTLKASWYNLKNDVLIPLLARMTGVVLKVVEE